MPLDSSSLDGRKTFPFGKPIEFVVCRNKVTKILTTFVTFGSNEKTIEEFFSEIDLDNLTNFELRNHALESS